LLPNTNGASPEPNAPGYKKALTLGGKSRWVLNTRILPKGPKDTKDTKGTKGTKDPKDLRDTKDFQEGGQPKF
jgi:hypothetical protein